MKPEMKTEHNYINKTMICNKILIQKKQFKFEFLELAI